MREIKKLQMLEHKVNLATAATTVDNSCSGGGK